VLLDLVRDQVRFIPAAGDTLPSAVLVVTTIKPDQLIVIRPNLVQVIDQHLSLRPLQTGTLHLLKLVLPPSFKVEDGLMRLPLQLGPFISNTQLLLLLSLGMLE